MTKITKYPELDAILPHYMAMLDAPSNAVAPRYEERQYYPVRCCCTPVKVLGFLSLPTAPSGSQKRTVSDWNRTPHQIELRTMQEHTKTYGGQPIICSELAVYSENRGIEFWRTIPDFVEARNDPD